MAHPTRRDLLAAAGATGIAAFAGAAPQGSNAKFDTGRIPRRAKGQKSVAGLVTPKLDRVRAAFIGVGQRGSGHVAQMMMMEGVDIVAICDPYAPSAEASRKRVVAAGRPEPAMYTGGGKDYQRMFDKGGIDMVIIATPWEWHVPMAVDAMNAGIHAFVEVPAATTVEDCWKLVDTSERTGKHCMMMENVNYGREELMVLNMCRQGVFGELLHGEAAYIHDLRWQMKEIDHSTGSWRTYQYAKRNGNLYPTHGLGPVAQYMNINRGDRLDYMSSVSSPALVRHEYAMKEFPAGHERQKIKFVAGDINTSIVKTVVGRTLMIQWDEQLPRPYTRHNFIQGTKGAWGGFPDRLVIEGVTKSTEEWTEGDDLKPFYEKYDHPLWKRVGDEAVKAGGHGGMDFVMLWRIVYCLRNGLPLDQDVYDAATWSVISPLSELSVANRGRSVDVPDFTRGGWKTMKPLEIVS